MRTLIGHSVNRRSFLRGAAALVGALSLPWPTKEEPRDISPPVCPKCGTTMVRYVAGLPGDWDELRRAQGAGEFVWKGSCVVHPDDPKWACARCHRAELEERLAELNSFDYKPGFADPGVRFIPVNETAEEMEKRREETKRRLRSMPRRKLFPLRQPKWDKRRK